MGAIFAVIPRNGATGSIDLAEEAFRRAAARSPYRGVPAFITLPQGVLGIQTLGEDASLGSEGPWHVALHGWISNWGDLAQRFSLSWPPTATPAQRFAIAYARWGEAFLKASRGEFSAIAVDTRDGDVSAIRGHLGTKPLFYTQSENLLVIATEIRQAMAGCGRVTPLNKGVLIELLAGVSLAHEDTCWQDVNRVMAAHVVHFIGGEHRGMERYWLPLAPDHYPKRSLDDLAEELRGLLFQAVERSLPDSSFGVEMSGGMDSTTVWAFTKSLAWHGLRKAEGGTPISMVFPDDPDCDESPYIDAMLAHTRSDGLKINASDANPLDFLSDQTGAMDAPVSGTLYHVDLLASCARDHGASVLLGGAGGDECFGGSLYALADELWGGQTLSCLKNSLSVAVPDGMTRLSFLWRYAFRPQNLRFRLGMLPTPNWLSKSARKLLSVRIVERLPLSVPHLPRAIGELYHNLINHSGGEGNECVEQRAAVFSMDCRSPLLDPDILEFAFSVNPLHQLAQGQTKHLLRRAARDYLPEVVRLRPNKTGFNSNFTCAIQAIIKQGWNPGAGALVNEGMLDPAKVNKFVAEGSNQNTGTLFIWGLYCIEKFVTDVSAKSTLNNREVK